MRYLKTHIKVLVAIFFALSLMALAGEPIESNSTNNIATSDQYSVD